MGPRSQGLYASPEGGWRVASPPHKKKHRSAGDGRKQLKIPVAVQR